MLVRAYARILDLTGVLVGLVFGVIAVLICIDIFARNGPLFLDLVGLGAGMRPASLPWVTELTEYLMYGAAFIGAPWALRLGAHVRVDIFVSGLSEPVTRALNRLIDCVGFTASLVLLIYGAIAVLEAWDGAMYARKTWDFPEWLLLMPIPICGLMLAIEFVLRFFRVGEFAEHVVDPISKTAI